MESDDFPVRSGLVKVTLAIPPTSIPCTDSNTNCARRQSITEPDDRLTIRNSLFPSSMETSRTRRPSLDTTTFDPISHNARSACATRTYKWWTYKANVAGRGISSRSKPMSSGKYATIATFRPQSDAFLCRQVCWMSNPCLRLSLS